MNRREEEMLIKAAMAARLPWLSPDAEPEYVFVTDPPELIEKCCHCSRAECVDCIANREYEHAGNPYGKQRKADIKTFADLLLKGFDRQQVCSALGIGNRTFYNYKNQLKGAMA